MANEQQWTKERQANAKDSLDKLGWPLTEIETRAMLAEIERAWGEIEALSASEANCVREALAEVGGLRAEVEIRTNEARRWERVISTSAFAAGMSAGDSFEGLPGAVDKLLNRMLVAESRLAHAHDSASALYVAAGEVSRQLLAFGECPSYMAQALAAAIDPALSTAALAECQRRDGLDEQIRTLTAPVEESALNGWARQARKVYAGPEEREWDEIPETSRELWRLVVAPFAQQIRARERLIEGIARAAGKGEHETFLDLPAKVAALNTTLTNVWNTLATALNELDINPVLDPEACAQQAAGVIVRTLTGRPVLTAEQARAQVEAIVYVLGRSPFAMVGPLVKLLMRVAAPETAEQASVARAFEVVTPPPEMATTTGEPDEATTYAIHPATGKPWVPLVPVRTEGAKPAWLDGATTLWEEDKGTPDRETVDHAWRRLLKMPRPNAPPHAIHDAGDTVYHLHTYGRIYVSSYCGDAIMRTTSEAWRSFIASPKVSQ